MALNGTRTTIHFDEKGEETDKIACDFHVNDNNCVYDDMNADEINVINKKGGHTEIWVATEEVDDVFEVAIYKDGIYQETVLIG